MCLPLPALPLEYGFLELLARSLGDRKQRTRPRQKPPAKPRLGKRLSGQSLTALWAMMRLCSCQTSCFCSSGFFQLSSEIFAFLGFPCFQLPPPLNFTSFVTIFIPTLQKPTPGTVKLLESSDKVGGFPGALRGDWFNWLRCELRQLTQR